MELAAIIGLFLIVWGALTVLVAVLRPKAIWQLGKLQGFVQLLTERGTSIFLSVVAVLTAAPARQWPCLPVPVFFGGSSRVIAFEIRRSGKLQPVDASDPRVVQETEFLQGALPDVVVRSQVVSHHLASQIDEEIIQEQPHGFPAINVFNVVFEVVGISSQTHSAGVLQTISPRETCQSIKCILPAGPEFTLHVQGETAPTPIAYRFTIFIMYDQIKIGSAAWIDNALVPARYLLLGHPYRPADGRHRFRVRPQPTDERQVRFLRDTQGQPSPAF